MFRYMCITIPMAFISFLLPYPSSLIRFVGSLLSRLAWRGLLPILISEKFRLLYFLLTGVGDAFIMGRRTASLNTGMVMAVQRAVICERARGKVISHHWTKLGFTKAINCLKTTKGPDRKLKNKEVWNSG
jgi:hypothetical protein